MTAATTSDAQTQRRRDAEQVVLLAIDTCRDSTAAARDQVDAAVDALTAALRLRGQTVNVDAVGHSAAVWGGWTVEPDDGRVEVCYHGIQRGAEPLGRWSLHPEDAALAARHIVDGDDIEWSIEVAS